MKRRFVLVAVIMLCVATLLPACRPAPTPEPAAPTPAPAPITLKFSSIIGPTVHLSRQCVWWMDEVTERTGGRVEFQTFWSEAIIKATEVIPALKKGLIDVADQGVTYNVAYLPLSGLTEMIYVTDAFDARNWATWEQYKINPAFREEYEGNGLKVLFFQTITPGIMATAKKPVRTLEDFKGLKLRAYGYFAAMLERLGGTAVPIPLPEEYEAIQRGVVDGTIGKPFTGIVTTKLVEICPYYTYLGSGTYGTWLMVMSKTAWDGLPLEIQKVIDEVNEEGMQNWAELAIAEMQLGIDAIDELGLEMIRPPDAELERIRVAADVDSMWEEAISAVEEKGLPAREFWAQHLELIKKYEPKSIYKDPFK